MLAPRPVSVLFKLLAFTLVVVTIALLGCSGDNSPSDADAGPYVNVIHCPAATQCGDSCIDTTLNPKHCGACDNACADGQVCSAGKCVSSCPDSLVACNGGCIDPLTNGAFCGASGTCTGASAGQACGAGQVCVAGTCQSNDATLASLTFSSGTLSPAFSPATTVYILEAPSLINLRVTATPTTPGATLTLDGAPLAAGVPSERILRTSAPFPTLSLEVTAPGGATTVYTIVLLGTEVYTKASNTGADDRFGASVALDGDTLVVGAPNEASNATGVNGDQLSNSIKYSGAVYVFTRSGTTWSQQAYIKASNTGVNDFFGGSVALSGDTLVVGAPGESSNAKGVNGNQLNDLAISSGAVYVFTRSGTTWSQQAYIKASNTASYDLFGTSVAISGDTLAVGAPGEDSNATGVNGDQTNDGAASSGAVYVFTRSGTTWSQQAYIKASNTAANNNFGLSIALSGDTLAVGANGEASNATGVNNDQTNKSAPASGAVYVFTRSGTT